MWAWEMPKGRRTIGNLCLFDIKSWSDYIQPTYWTSVISWHSWQHIHIERNKIWSDQARSWVSACIKMIRGLRSHFFSWGKTAMGWLWVPIISVSLQSMSKDFLTLKAAEWITQHSASIVSWYLDTVSSHHDLFLSISFHSCPTTALAVFNSSPACPFLCSFTWPFYISSHLVALTVDLTVVFISLHSRQVLFFLIHVARTLARRPLPPCWSS